MTDIQDIKVDCQSININGHPIKNIESVRWKKFDNLWYCYIGFHRSQNLQITANLKIPGDVFLDGTFEVAGKLYKITYTRKIIRIVEDENKMFYMVIDINIHDMVFESPGIFVQKSKIDSIIKDR